jgi:hypothetical protein
MTLSIPWRSQPERLNAGIMPPIWFCTSSSLPFEPVSVGHDAVSNHQQV